MRLDQRWMTAWTIAGSGLAVFTGAAQASSGISVFPDQSCIWQIINFLVLIWALNLIVYRPIRNIVARRQEHISGLDKSIEQIKRDVDEKESSFAGGIKEARVDGMKVKNALLEDGAAAGKKIIESINKKTQQTLAENKAKIAQDVKKAAADLQQEVEAFAVDIGRKILGRDLS